MNREPLALYLFRFFVSVTLVGLVAMLYWSSLLLEEKVGELEKQFTTLQRELQESEKKAAPVEEKKEGSHTLLQDSSLKNLLQEDPFFTTTLPQKLLPKGFKAEGTLLSATIGKPDNLHPFTNWSHISPLISQCSVAVAGMQFGKYEGFLVPDMAIKMEERVGEGGAPEFWIFLRDNVYWEPLETRFFGPGFLLAPHFLKRHQVTAHDFKFYYDAVMNPSVEEGSALSLRTLFADIEEVRVIDPLTFAVRWKTKTFTEGGKEVKKTKYIAKQLTASLRPLASFVYQYFPDGSSIIDDQGDPDAYRKNAVWAQNFSHHWAKNVIPSCGAWLFDGLTDREIRFKRNPRFYRPLAALADKMVVSFKGSPDLIWQDFKSNRLDTYDLRPEQQLEFNRFLNSPQYLQQADNNASINRLDYLMRSYNYLGWNQATPFFNSVNVRRAMTMAIDRERIINQNLNGLAIPITGPFFVYSPAYDPSIKPLPFDPHQAKLLLEEEGWSDSEGTGTLYKTIDGKKVPFTFTLTYFVKNPTSKSISEYIATALKEIGVNVLLNGIDITDLSAAIEQKNFDALYMGWAMGSPPEDPKGLWHSSFADEPGSSNIIHYKNKEADDIIEALEYESDKEKRLALYHRFDRILADEQPYTFLFTQKVAMLYRERLQNVFIPADRQDLVPGANVGEPDTSIFWIKAW